MFGDDFIRLTALGLVYALPQLLLIRLFLNNGTFAKVADEDATLKKRFEEARI